MYSLMFELGAASYYRYKDKWRINLYNYEPDKEIYSTQQIETQVIEKVIQRIKRTYVDYRPEEVYTSVLEVKMRDVESWKFMRGTFPSISLCLKEIEYTAIVIRLINPESLELSSIRALMKGNLKLYLDNELVQLSETIDVYPNKNRPLQEIDCWYKDLIRTVKADKDLIDSRKRR